MSVKIRLAKIGKRHAPAYRVVVSHTRTKRNGKFLDIIGFYNPTDPTTNFTFDKDKYESWTAKGAQTTKAVKDLIDGNYQYIKYEPKAEKAGTKTQAATEKSEVEATNGPAVTDDSTTKEYTSDESQTNEDKPEEQTSEEKEN